ncbi:hypothetical protein GGS26DRAFT_403369 [Hypomontagnella submonticulosa]|nr:hypothetical protein GGS26DRAFT_403369 [Hypomontagnella submonticulosa]
MHGDLVACFSTFSSQPGSILEIISAVHGWRCVPVQRHHRSLSPVGFVELPLAARKAIPSSDPVVWRINWRFCTQRDTYLGRYCMIIYRGYGVTAVLRSYPGPGGHVDLTLMTRDPLGLGRNGLRQCEVPSSTRPGDELGISLGSFYLLPTRTITAVSQGFCRLLQILHQNPFFPVHLEQPRCASRHSSSVVFHKYCNGAQYYRHLSTLQYSNVGAPKQGGTNSINAISTSGDVPAPKHLLIFELRPYVLRNYQAATTIQIS